jgi:16S rRNA (uracil1498-N3)-methyltransferase
MRRDRFFLPHAQQVITDPDLVNKIARVLRVREGDEVCFFDGQGHEFTACVHAIGKKEIRLKDIVESAVQEAPAVRLTLAFSLIKGQKVDIALQKCTELGIDAFVPFLSDFSNMGEPGDAKQEHFKGVIEEATAQSRRLWMPSFADCVSFDEMFARLSSYAMVVLADPYEGVSQDAYAERVRAVRSGAICFLVGPEGGFSDDEVARFLALPNVVRLKFSSFMLRAETAAMFVTGLTALILDKRS